MTRSTGDSRVLASERKLGGGVIKRSPIPSRRCVALDAVLWISRRHVVGALGCLIGVQMTALANYRRTFVDIINVA